MTDNLQIKSDDEMKAALLQLFDLANVAHPHETISAMDVLTAIRELKALLAETSSVQPALTADGGEEGGEGGPFSTMASLIQGGPQGNGVDISQQSILIVGELGIVTYQLKLALTKRGANVSIVKGVDEAITEYQRRHYTGILIDIFMPTEREGLLVLMEVKRLDREKNGNVQAVVLATPVKEKRMDLKEVCRQRGASVYLEKTEGWHQRVLDFFSGQLDMSELH